MKRYILTGAPGSGKTSIILALQSRGYDVVEEAATAVIAAEQAQGNDEALGTTLVHRQDRQLAATAAD